MSTPTQVQLTGGNFQDSEGNLLENGYLEMELSQDASITGVGNICSGIKIRIQLDANGDAVSGSQAWGNDVMNPPDTFYKVTGYTEEGQPAWGPNNQQIVGSTFDLGAWVPNQIYSWTPSQVQPIVLEVNGAAASSQILQNLVAGTNITLTDEGGGSIKISAANSSAASADFMLGPGIVNLAGISGFQAIGGWAGGLGANMIAFIAFNLPMGISNFVLMDGSFSGGLVYGENIAVAFYTADGLTLLWQSGPILIPNQSNVAMSITIPSLSLPAGSYVMAWTEDAYYVSCSGMPTPAIISFHSGTSESNIINQSANLRYGVAGNLSSSCVFPSTLAMSYGGGAVDPSTSGWDVAIPAILFHA